MRPALLLLLLAVLLLLLLLLIPLLLPLPLLLLIPLLMLLKYHRYGYCCSRPPSQVPTDDDLERLGVRSVVDLDLVVLEGKVDVSFLREKARFLLLLILLLLILIIITTRTLILL